MGVITISQQMGSQGREVGAAAARALGYRIVWREVINQAALQAGTPEVALSTIDELGLLGLCPSPKACRAYCRAVQQVMEELAAQDNIVIVGRAGQVILRHHPAALHVRVVASISTRAERVAQAHGISIAAARAQVEASDAFRRNYLKRLYRVRWDDPDLYDLIVNTERVTLDGAAQLVCAALEQHRSYESLLPRS